jgi:hypothetical protein
MGEVFLALLDHTELIKLSSINKVSLDIEGKLAFKVLSVFYTRLCARHE